MYCCGYSTSACMTSTPISAMPNTRAELCGARTTRMSHVISAEQHDREADQAGLREQVDEDVVRIVGDLDAAERLRTNSY